MSARATALAVALLVTGCDREVTDFGKPCGSGEDCSGDSARCVGGVCVPPRQQGDLGESCENALPIGGAGFDRSSAPLVHELSLEGASANYATSCAGAPTPDVVLTFTIPERSSPFPVRIRTELAAATLSLRPLADAACDTELSDACAAGGELLLERVGPGSWALVVGALGTVTESVRVIVEPIDCPEGYLPFDEATCAGFRAIDPPHEERAFAQLTALPDGRAVLSGGADEQGIPIAGAELFEPVAEAWTFLVSAARTPPHGALVAGEHLVLLDGGAEPQLVVNQGGEDAVLPLDIEPFGGGPSGLLSTAAHLSAGLPSGAVAILSDDSDHLLRLQREPQRCYHGVCPNRAGICVVDPDAPSSPGICLCPDGPCMGHTRLSGDSVTTGARPMDLASRGQPIVAGLVRGGEHVAVHGGDLLADLEITTKHWRTISVTPRDRPALSAINAGVLVVGGLVDGAPTAEIELVNASLQSRTSLAPLHHARADHGQATLPDGRVLMVGGRGVGGDALMSAELIDGEAGTVTRLPSLSAGLATARAVTLADGRVLVLGSGDDGGPLTQAWVFEVIPHGARLPPPPSNPCGPLVPLDTRRAFGSDAPLVVEETTVGERDRFHDPACGSSYDSLGPERLFSFSLTQPASLRAATSLERAALVLWNSGCSDQPSLGCALARASNDPPKTWLSAPNLPAGNYVLVVEAHLPPVEPDSVRHGSAFTLSLQLGAPASCTLGDEDPDDDSPVGARHLLPLSWDDYPVTAAPEVAAGTLCAGDEDYLIVERWSSSSDLWMENASRNDSTIAPAIVDEAASLAAGAPVYSFPEGLPFGDGETGTGIFLVKLAVSANDPFERRWELWQESDSCAPEDVDSLVAVLDDGHHPARRVQLPPSGTIDRCLTSDQDVDVTVVEAQDGLDTLVRIDDAYDVAAQLYALGAPDAPLGAAVGAPIPNDAFGVVPAGTAPYIAVALFTATTNGEWARFTVDHRALSVPCDEATPLSDDGTWPLDSATLSARLTPEDFGDCTGYSADGDEAVGAITLGDGDVLDAELEPDGDADISLYLLTGCLVGTATCVAGLDDSSGGFAESIRYTHAGADQTFYLVADSYSTSPYSATLRWTVTRAGP